MPLGSPKGRIVKDDDGDLWEPEPDGIYWSCRTAATESLDLDELSELYGPLTLFREVE